MGVAERLPREERDRTPDPGAFPLPSPPGPRQIARGKGPQIWTRAPRGPPSGVFPQVKTQNLNCLQEGGGEPLSPSPLAP